MKAVILAAGLGTRLQPLTNSIPKAMVTIGDKPLLQHHLELLNKHQIKDVWVNIHYLPQVIKNYFQDGSGFGMRISYSYEEVLLGTSGCLKNKTTRIEQSLKDDDFLVVYGDNFTNINYSKLIEFHNEKKSFFSMALYRSPDVASKGMVETDNEGRIIRMIEKPPVHLITTDQVNAGIYICSRNIFDYIPEGFSDFGFDVIPKLITEKKEIYGFIDDYYVQDIGTPKGLEKARIIFKESKIT